MGEVAGIRAVCHAPAHLPMGIGTAEGTVEERSVGSQEDCPPMIQQPRRRIARLSTVARRRRPGAAAGRRARRRGGSRRAHASGTTQDLDATNPFNTELVVGYEAFQLTYNLLTEFDKDAKPGARASPTPGSASADRVTFHIRDGMKWSDGTPATSKDVCFSWGLAMAAIKDDVDIGYGYLDPGVKDAGRHEDRVPGRRARSSPTRPTSRTGSSRSTSRSCPSTSGQVRLQEDRRGEVRRRRSSAPGRTRSPSGRPASSRGSSATRTTGATRASPTRSSCGSSRTARTHGPGAEGGRARLRPRRQRRTSSSSSQADPTYTAVAGKANGWTPARVQHLRHRDRQDDQGRRAVDQGAARPGVPRRPRLRRRQPGARRPRPRRLRRRRHDRSCRRSCPTGTSSRTTPALRHRARQAEARRGRATSSTRTASASTRRASRSACGSSTRTRRRLREVGAVRAGVVRPAGHRRHAAELSTATRLGNLVLPPEGDGKAKYDIELWGWVGNPDPNALLDDLPLRPDRQRVGQPVLQPGRTTSCTTSSRRRPATQRHATLAQMQNLIYDEAPYDILYYDANLDVYRNDRFAGWQNMPADGTPLFTYGTARLHAAHATRRPSRRRTPEAPDRGGLRGTRAAAPAAPTAAPSAAPRPAARTAPAAARAATRRCCSCWWRWSPSWSSAGSSAPGGAERAPTSRTNSRRR